MMNVNDPNAKADTIRRLRRIEGQIRGVQRMVNEDRDCQEVNQQFASIKSAVYSANLAYIRAYISECMLKTEESSSQKRQEIVKDLIEILTKLP